MADTDTVSFGLRLRDFVAASPTSYHAAREVARQLVAAGFREEDEREPWNVTPGGHVVVRGGAVIAYVIGGTELREFRIVGAHTDSPALKLKPEPHMTGYGFSRVAVETYGGLLMNSLLNRDLGIAGRLTTVDGEDRLFSTGPVMFLPQLAPHLDRSVNEKLVLDRQANMQPVWATGERSIIEVIAEAAGVDAQQIGGMDAYSYDAQEPAIINGEFLASGRQDNLTSVFAGLAAFLELGTDVPAGVVPVFAAFDHEEVGSSTPTGAAGPILEYVLRRTAEAMGCGGDAYYRVMAASTCVSSDAGHSINPNYPGYHDPSQYPVMGKGPMVKINANQRYASDSRGIALWERAARSVNAPHQTFVSNNAVACGSTIGPITATRLGIDTVDVGVPLLSMHSVREVSSIADDRALSDILRGYWELA